jgi:P-type E1-E2 ATPase
MHGRSRTRREGRQAGGGVAALRLQRVLSADYLAGVSIVASFLLHEYLAGAIVIVMLVGGNILERYAVARAASVLKALAKRVPTIACTAERDIPVDQVAVGDELSVLPHEICPVDGEVVSGHGSMDESYLTGEPFTIAKGPGAKVLSGAINGGSALVIRTTRVAADSRFARIMRVMREAEQRRPALRRIGDQIGAVYTPIALALAAGVWWWTGQPERFLSVVIIATPCPLIIAIPVAIIGAISTARGAASSSRIPPRSSK